MENIIALLRDAKRDIERGRVSGTDKTVYLDCALIYIEGAIEIARNHAKAKTNFVGYKEETR